MKTNSDPESYTEQLVREKLDGDETLDYKSLDWDERGGVLGELVKNDLNLGWEIIQGQEPLKEGDTDFPELLAKLLEARGDSKYTVVADAATGIAAYLVTHSVHYASKYITEALEETESYLRREAEEKFDEDDRGDHLYEAEKDRRMMRDIDNG